jgi:hypothetical protein
MTVSTSSNARSTDVGDMHAKFWAENLNIRYGSGGLGTYRRILFAWVFAVPWFRGLFAYLSPRKSRFSLESVNMEFAVEKISL